MNERLYRDKEGGLVVRGTRLELRSGSQEYVLNIFRRLHRRPESSNTLFLDWYCDEQLTRSVYRIACGCCRRHSVVVQRLATRLKSGLWTRMRWLGGKGR
jgi:hypothetical protein